jgi:hypothetical protein
MQHAIIAPVAAVFIALSSSAQSAQQAVSTAMQADGRYAPYAFLIGDWLSDENGARMRQSFSWGPDRSYIRYSTFTGEDGKERLHFDGIMVWNGRTRHLDYVFAVEPGSGIQEKGTIRVDADGSWVRDVEFTNANGTVREFRQTISRTGPDTAVTSLMLKTNEGWRPNFPGSDRIEMRRR